MSPTPDIPVGNGFTVSFRLSERGIEAEWLPDVPTGRKARRVFPAYRKARDAFLVAISGWGQPEDKRRSLEAGFDQHLAKPVDFEQIRDLLNDFHTMRQRQ